MPLGAGWLRYEKTAGPLSQPVGVVRTLANPQLLRLVGLPCGSLRPYGSPASFNPPSWRRPDYRPGSLRSQAQAHLSAATRPKACRSLSDPPHCAGRRADRPEGESSRKKPGPPSRLLAARACPRARRTTPDDWRPLREAIARGLSHVTLVIFAFAKPPWMYRSPAKGTKEPDSPTLSRTVANLKKFLSTCNEKNKYS
jgi:hypothetical protein